ncbi:MAG: hypothetical protein ACE5EC_01135 [Phycisphaerae bacterium]
MIEIPRSSTIVQALALILLPAFSGCAMTPSSSPDASIKDTNQFQGAGRTDVRIDVFEVTPPPDRVSLLNAESLEAAAESGEGLGKKLREIGPTRLLFHLAQPVELQEEFTFIIGTRLPITRSTTRSTGGAVQTSVSYEDVGCNIEMKGSWGRQAPEQGRVQLELELSSVGESTVKIGPETQAPIFRTYQQKFGMRFTAGKPIVLISMDSNARAEDPLAYVIRVEFERAGM